MKELITLCHSEFFMDMNDANPFLVAAILVYVASSRFVRLSYHIFRHIRQCLKFHDLLSSAHSLQKILQGNYLEIRVPSKPQHYNDMDS